MFSKEFPYLNECFLCISKDFVGSVGQKLLGKLRFFLDKTEKPRKGRTEFRALFDEQFPPPESGTKNGFLSMSRDWLKVGKKWALTHFDQLLHPPKSTFLPSFRPILGD